jgi:hypothetical protein
VRVFEEVMVLEAVPVLVRVLEGVMVFDAVPV